MRIESDQRPGVDALSLEYSSGPLSGLDIVYAPGDEKGKRSAGARIRINVKGYDLSMIFGEFREDKVIGFDFAGNSGEIVTRNRHFLAAGVGYDLTPLLRFDLYAIYDMDGGSIFLNPDIKYNLFSNLDWIAGIQSFSGDEDSEYGLFQTFTTPP